MIPRLHKRGKSFKGACSYVLHDPEKSKSSDRVAWSETHNLVSSAEDAWFEMFLTHRDQALLKAASGVDRRGRKNDRPVLHFSLSWAPGEAPDDEHMRATALSALKALGLDEHQALIAAHTDKAHTHLHIVVNTVHPITGRTAPQSFTKLAFSRWAEAYEREHGIHCEQRVANNADREAIRRSRKLERANGLEPGAFIPIKGLSPSRREWLQQRYRDGDTPDPARRILSALTYHQSTFTMQDLARAVDAVTPDAASFNDLMAKVEASEEFARLPGTDRLSTKSLVRAEAILVATVDAMGQDKSHPLNALGKRIRSDWDTLTPDQAGALEHVTGPEAIACVTGFAGTGKSTMLAAARSSWEASGYTVRGAALSGIAGQGLQHSTGIASSTLHALQWGLENNAITFTKRDVLVIDEAGMVGSRQMQKIVSTARLAGAKIVLVGDAEQLQAIEAGAPFRAVAERCGAASMGEVRRQREDWQRQATIDLGSGRAGRAIDAYHLRDAVVAADTKREAVDALLAEWAGSLRGAKAAPDLILAPTRKDVAKLNTAARRAMQEKGYLGSDRSIEATEDREDLPARRFSLDVAIGERLMFTRNDTRMGVRNGSLGTLVAFGAGTIAVRLDGRDSPVIVDLARYTNLAHGYAMTVHKAQGVTVERALVLAGPTMDRHMTYVALSRHRADAKLYFGRDEFAGLSFLRQRLSRAQTKDMTIDYPPPGKLMDVGVRSDPPTDNSADMQKRSDRIRAQAVDWRKRNGDRDFGLEL